MSYMDIMKQITIQLCSLIKKNVQMFVKRCNINQIYCATQQDYSFTYLILKYHKLYSYTRLCCKIKQSVLMISINFPTKQIVLMHSVNFQIQQIVIMHSIDFEIQQTILIFSIRIRFLFKT